MTKIKYGMSLATYGGGQNVPTLTLGDGRPLLKWFKVFFSKFGYFNRR